MPRRGRITGTVIDRTTSAPAPGIPVAVGEVVVTTDENGNYDRNGLPAGSYRVALQLPPSRGEPAQGPITIPLSAGATVIQHLAFRSLLATPEVQATAATPTTAPVPTVLPNTGGTDGAPTVIPGLLLVLAGAGLHLAGRQR